jgi:hypothetical protein
LPFTSIGLGPAKSIPQQLDNSTQQLTANGMEQLGNMYRPLQLSTPQQ